MEKSSEKEDSSTGKIGSPKSITDEGKLRMPTDETVDVNAIDGSEEELWIQAIIQHARFLGMDPDIDKDLLWIAEEAISATDSLPPGRVNIYR